MHVVITGGAGFLGQRLARQLLSAARSPDRAARRSAIERIVLVDVVAATGFRRSAHRDDRRGHRRSSRREARVIDRGIGSVFHLAAVVSGQAERDFDLGMRVNLDASRLLLEACRARGQPGRACCSRARWPSMAATAGCRDRRNGARPAVVVRRAEGDRRAAARRLHAQGLRRRPRRAAADDQRSTRASEPGGIVVRERHHPRAAERRGGDLSRRRANCASGCSSPRRAIESLIALHDVDGDVARAATASSICRASRCRLRRWSRRCARSPARRRDAHPLRNATRPSNGSSAAGPARGTLTRAQALGLCRRRELRGDRARVHRRRPALIMEKITADEAARLIEDGDAILISGSGGGHAVPEALLAAVERRFLAEGKPRGLTSVSVVGVGDRAALGATHLAHEGLLKRAITSALVDSPGLVRLAAENKIEAYTLPQGVLSQLMRDMAAGRPGLLTKTGPPHVRRSAPAGRAAEPAHAAGFRRSRQPGRRGMAVLQAGAGQRRVPARHDGRRGRQRHDGGGGRARRDARDGAGDAPRRRHRHRAGQAHGAARHAARQAGAGSPASWSTSSSSIPSSARRTRRTTTRAIPASCAFRIGDIKPLPFGPRKVIVRRAAMELFPGAICNLGAGVSTGLSTIAAEEGLLDAAMLTNEQGLIGGAPITGRDSGGGQNFAAMIEQPAQFDFYDGGGLDLAFLSFAEVDARATSTSAASATGSSASAASSTSARTRDA